MIKALKSLFQKVQTKLCSRKYSNMLVIVDGPGKCSLEKDSWWVSFEDLSGSHFQSWTIEHIQ